MTRSLNKVMLIGNLARDPSLRTTTIGTSVCNFTLITNRDFTDSKTNTKQEIPEFHSIVAWSGLAEVCAKILKTGDRVYVEGRIQSKKYTDKTGIERNATEIVISEMMLLPRGRDAENFDDDVPPELL